MRRPGVLLADDHPIVADALAALLREEFDLVATVDDGKKLVGAARRLQPDVIVADIEMPVMGGLEALRQLRLDGVGVPILILSAHGEAPFAASAVRAGAAGFVFKPAAGDELIEAVRDVLAGQVYMSPHVRKEKVVTTVSQPRSPASSGD